MNWKAKEIIKELENAVNKCCSLCDVFDKTSYCEKDAKICPILMGVMSITELANLLEDIPGTIYK